jgi:hypothetical protein
MMLRLLFHITHLVLLQWLVHEAEIGGQVAQMVVTKLYKYLAVKRYANTSLGKMRH